MNWRRNFVLGKRRFGLLFPCASIALVWVCLAPVLAAAKKPAARRRTAPQAPPPARWDQATLDRFFEDVPAALGPRPVVADMHPAAGEPSGSVQDSKPSNADSNEDGSAVAWSKTISAEALEDEIKAVQASLGECLKTASKFKSSGFRTARQNFSWLVVLLDVVGRYDGEVRWRDSALALRDGASRAGRNCKAASDGTFKEAKQRAAELVDMLRGQRPDAAEKPAAVGWPELVDRAPLMQRLETALRERLNAWTGSESEFQSHRDETVHEAQAAALLARVIAHADYEFATEDTYQAEAQSLAAAADALIAAAEANDFERAQAAARQATKSCDNCHTNFRS